jgi:hypothetical protein
MDKWRKLEQVICRSERRADEKPVKFRGAGEWVPVDKILSTRLERGPGESDPTYRVFEVECRLGVVWLRVATDGWVWEIKKQSARG